MKFEPKEKNGEKKQKNKPGTLRWCDQFALQFGQLESSKYNVRQRSGTRREEEQATNLGFEKTQVTHCGFVALGTSHFILDLEKKNAKNAKRNRGEKNEREQNERTLKKDNDNRMNCKAEERAKRCINEEIRSKNGNERKIDHPRQNSDKLVLCYLLDFIEH
jgi:hypothetical protein